MRESEIFKQAVLLGLKFGMGFALVVTLIIGGLFGYYIHKSFEEIPVSMQATQDGTNNNQEVINGKANN